MEELRYTVTLCSEGKHFIFKECTGIHPDHTPLFEDKKVTFYNKKGKFVISNLPFLVEQE